MVFRLLVVVGNLVIESNFFPRALLFNPYGKREKVQQR
jgi:hypothetical protein